jgi:ADP-heptose:LPS heptosyltransferase
VELHILTKQTFSHLFEANPHITRIHTYNDSLAAVVEQLRNENFDHIVDLQKNFRSFRVKLALGKPATSFPKLNLKKYLLVRMKINLMPELHIVDRYFEAVKKLGVANDGKGLDFFIPGHEKINPTQYVESAADGYYAVVVGGKHNTKIFPAAKLIEVMHHLKKPLLLLGGEEDAQRAAEVVKASNGRAHNLCGKLSIYQSASVIEQADAVLTNDTGLMHIAAALHKPIVSVWGSTVPRLGMYPYMPQNPENSIIIENNLLSCRPCSKLGYSKCPKGHFKCMMDIDSESVANNLKKPG